MTKEKIAVIGQGYVGLPLSIEFAKKFEVLGFDINSIRVNELNQGKDSTLEANLDDLKRVMSNGKNAGGKGLTFSCDEEELRECNIYIVTVPTPIDQFKAPDLKPLKMASRMIGKYLSSDDLVIYESTVYPGCTEEECVPELEKSSGMKFNKDFYCGYSPERINPGDKVNTLTKIVKVTSGSTPEIGEKVDSLYAAIISAGTHLAPNIKVAEASKAIENAQRDLNISFVNELALIFDRVGIDTNDVIEAAATKWNFLKYKPGLVGGHCIGVDPYYLAHKAEALGYHPQVILSGRRVNDNMGMFVANKVVKLMIENGQVIKGSRVLVLGITFKENCPDIRNTRVVDIVEELSGFGCNVEILDPWASYKEVEEEYGYRIQSKIEENNIFGAIVVAVSHNEFMTLNYDSLLVENGVIFDIKGILPKQQVTARL